MKITIGGHNNVYTYTWAVSAGVVTLVATLVISGVQGFDLTQNSLDTVYDTTTSTFLNCKRVTCSYAYVAGLPVWTYVFYSVPDGTATGDSLVITLDIPDAYAAIAIQQYQASKV